jgi:hypothetical protein
MELPQQQLPFRLLVLVDQLSQLQICEFEPYQKGSAPKWQEKKGKDVMKVRHYKDISN